MLIYFLKACSLGLSAAALPGPLQALLLSESVKHGWRKSLPMALTPLLSDGPILLLAVLVLSRTPAWFLTTVQLAGGVFILYLAYAALMAFKQFETRVVVVGEFPGLLKSALLNFLNPNPWLFWSLVGAPIFLQGLGVSGWWAAGFLLGFFGCMLLALAGLIVVFSQARRAGDGFNRGLLLVSALGLFVFGGFQVVRGVLGLIS